MQWVSKWNIAVLSCEINADHEVNLFAISEVIHERRSEVHLSVFQHYCAAAFSRLIIQNERIFAFIKNLKQGSFEASHILIIVAFIMHVPALYFE